MATISLYITLEPNRGKPVTLARVKNPALLKDAALAALAEAESTAVQMAAEDQILGELQGQEVRRLRQSLELVLPEILMAAGSLPIS
jgi:hypothetical protein